MKKDNEGLLQCSNCGVFEEEKAMKWCDECGEMLCLTCICETCEIEEESPNP